MWEREDEFKVRIYPVFRFAECLNIRIMLHAGYFEIIIMRKQIIQTIEL